MLREKNTLIIFKVLFHYLIFFFVYNFEAMSHLQLIYSIIDKSSLPHKPLCRASVRRTRTVVSDCPAWKTWEMDRAGFRWWLWTSSGMGRILALLSLPRIPWKPRPDRCQPRLNLARLQNVPWSHLSMLVTATWPIVGIHPQLSAFCKI